MTRILLAAWRSWLTARATIGIVGAIHLILAATLTHYPGWGLGNWLALLTGILCIACAAHPTAESLRVASAMSAVALAGWRALVVAEAIDLGASVVWMLVVVLELAAWSHLLPSAEPPPEAA